MSLNLNQNAPEIVNVIPLFSDRPTVSLSQDKKEEVEWESLGENTDTELDLLLEDRPSIDITETMDPLIAVMILNEKLSSMKETLGRINFYLEELEELVPKNASDSCCE